MYIYAYVYIYVIWYESYDIWSTTIAIYDFTIIYVFT